MTLKELALDIYNELTFSGTMPYKLATKEIERIIENDTRFFYDNWHYAVQDAYLVLPIKLFSHPDFKQNRRLQLPECVRFVHLCKEMKKGSVFGTIDRDFAEQKFIGSEIFLTPFMGESITYRLAVFSFLDLTKNLIVEDISYDYNKNNKILFFVGRTPLVDVVIKVSKEIEKEHLYNDELFQRYVRAHAKIRMGEQYALFDFPLPGNVKVNLEKLTAKAEAEMTQCLEMIKGEQTPSFMWVERF